MRHCKYTVWYCTLHYTCHRSTLHTIFQFPWNTSRPNATTIKLLRSPPTKPTRRRQRHGRNNSKSIYSWLGLSNWRVLFCVQTMMAALFNLKVTSFGNVPENWQKPNPCITETSGAAPTGDKDINHNNGRNKMWRMDFNSIFCFFFVKYYG